VELLPGDEPRGLDGVVSDGVIAADGLADAAQVLVMGGDDPLEGDLVTGSGRRERVGLLSGCHPRNCLHTQ
jgi:hypothetical protein